MTYPLKNKVQIAAEKRKELEKRNAQRRFKIEVAHYNGNLETLKDCDNKPHKYTYTYTNSFERAVQLVEYDLKTRSTDPRLIIIDQGEERGLKSAEKEEYRLIGLKLARRRRRAREFGAHLRNKPRYIPQPLTNPETSSIMGWMKWGAKRGQLYWGMSVPTKIGTCILEQPSKQRSYIVNGCKCNSCGVREELAQATEAYTKFIH